MIEKGWIYGIYYLPQSRFIYIGLTQDSVTKRKNHHLHYLRHNNHFNKKIQTIFHVSKEEDFVFAELTETVCKREELYELEQHYIKHYGTYNEDDEYACNDNIGGGGNPKRLSEESIAQMKKTRKRMHELGLVQTTDGEINGMHILKEFEVLEIIQYLRMDKYSHQQIANKYKVSRSTIGMIANGERWGYLQEVQDFSKNYKSTRKKPTVISYEDLVEIKILKEVDKLSYSEIANKTGHSYELIRKLPQRKKYKEINLEEII